MAFHAARLLSQSVADILGIDSFACPTMYKYVSFQMTVTSSSVLFFQYVLLLHFRCDNREIFSAGAASRIRLALISGMASCLLPKSFDVRRSM